MTRRRAFTQSDITRAAKVAKELGVTVRLEADGAVTISPVPPKTAKELEDEELDRELEAFERKHRTRA